MRLQLVSPLPDRGFAFNEGAYWPVGLLTIASYLRRQLPWLDVEILDEAILGAEQLQGRLGAEVVAVQSTSNLTYRRVLELSRIAKERGAFVIVGGSYAGMIPRQILQAQTCIDFVVAGPGEKPLRRVLKALGAKPDAIEGELEGVPGVWRRSGGGIVVGELSEEWDYEDARPLDYSLIAVEDYHANYRRALRDDFCGAFQIFTHFGCRYRDARRSAGKPWCSYCALGEVLHLRKPDDICREIREALDGASIREGSRVMLKCYGDNASALGAHLSRLADTLEQDPVLAKYELRWSVYSQSIFVTSRLVEIYQRLGVVETYVGFDSVDDEVQRVNGLGTTRAAHERAAELLTSAGVRLQAGFVLGCQAETKDSIRQTIEFCERLSASGNVDLFHASPIVLLAGSWAFRQLAERDSRLLEVDYVDPQLLQLQWLEKFCPGLGTANQAKELLYQAAGYISALGRLNSAFGGTPTDEAREQPGESIWQQDGGMIKSIA